MTDQTLPPPEGPEYTPCACSHIEPEHDPAIGDCYSCDCEAYQPAAAGVAPAADQTEPTDNCLHNPALTAQIGYPVRCPHCPPNAAPVPPTHWTKHVQRHHPEAASDAVLAALPDQRAAIRAAAFNEAADFVRGLLLARTLVTTTSLEAELRRMAAGAQQQTDTEAPRDTLPSWLHQRFGTRGQYAQSWDALSDDDRAYWEHEAAAVRRAVARGGFKTQTAQPARVSQQPAAVCIHPEGYNGECPCPPSCACCQVTVAEQQPAADSEEETQP